MAAGAATGREAAGREAASIAGSILAQQEELACLHALFLFQKSFSSGWK